MSIDNRIDLGPIPLVDLAAQQREIDDEVKAGLEEVFARTSFIGGPAVTAFEQEYANYIGTEYCVGVGNGTDALELAMRAVGVRAGGEVIMPANTFIATAEAACRIGATPVPVDVDPHYLLMDMDQALAAVTERTQAIIPVHLFGQTAFVERLAEAKERGIPIVEDAAQSHGATRNGRAAGSFGDAAGTSFYPGKNLGAAGDGGGVLTSRVEIKHVVRMLSAHGSATKYVHELVGMNSRLDTVQAVVLRAKLARLEGWNEARREAARRYGELLAGVPGLTLPQSAPGNVDVWHLYVIRLDDRDRVLRVLNEEGIGAGLHYPTPIHLTPALESLGYGKGSFPVAEREADRILTLPLYPHITAEQQERVSECLIGALRSAA